MIQSSRKLWFRPHCLTPRSIFLNFLQLKGPRHIYRDDRGSLGLNQLLVPPLSVLNQVELLTQLDVLVVLSLVSCKHKRRLWIQLSLYQLWTEHLVGVGLFPLHRFWQRLMNRHQLALFADEAYLRLHLLWKRSCA